jgi:hypothetical protein
MASVAVLAVGVMLVSAESGGSGITDVPASAISGNVGASPITGEAIGLTCPAPGLYTWTSGVSISTDVTLAGGPDDVWIFQIAGTLTQASATRVRLTGGAQTRNIFWQSAGAVSLGTSAQFEGTILAKTSIALSTGASANGRLLAQTAVTLQQNRVTIQ